MTKKMMSSKIARSVAEKVISKSSESRLTQSTKGSLSVEGYAVSDQAVAKAVSQRIKK